MKKIFAGLLIAGMFFAILSQEVSACDKTANCYATGTSVQCGYVQGYSAGHHLVTEPNGYSSYCEITEVSGSHNIYCTGCGVLLRTETRKCSSVHSNSHCFSAYNLCK